MSSSLSSDRFRFLRPRFGDIKQLIGLPGDNPPSVKKMLEALDPIMTALVCNIAFLPGFAHFSMIAYQNETLVFQGDHNEAEGSAEEPTIVTRIRRTLYNATRIIPPYQLPVHWTQLLPYPQGDALLFADANALRTTDELPPPPKVYIASYHSKLLLTHIALTAGR